MSVFLMGVYDQVSDRFCTVTKCGNGHDDATLERVNRQLTAKVENRYCSKKGFVFEMEKIGCDYGLLPTWLNCSRSLVPDFAVVDPKTAPVWEITGLVVIRL